MKSLQCSRTEYLIILTFILLLSSCDAFEGTERRAVVFRGVEHTALGSATLLSRGSKVTAINSGREGGVFIRTAEFERSDFYFQPVLIPEGSVFFAELVGVKNGASKTLMRVLHRGITKKWKRLEVDLRGLEAETAIVEFRRDGKVVYRKEDVRMYIRGETLVPIGRTTSRPTSVHYEETEEGTIVVIDYEAEPLNGPTRTALIRPAFEDAEAVRCTHIAIIPTTTASFSVRGVRMGGRGIDRLTIVKEQFESKRPLEQR